MLYGNHYVNRQYCVFFHYELLKIRVVFYIHAKFEFKFPFYYQRHTFINELDVQIYRQNMSLLNEIKHASIALTFNTEGFDNRIIV